MIKTNLSNEIINFLRSDLIQNLNILGVIENVKDIEIYVDDINSPKGVLVNRGYFNFIYTKEDSFIDDILNNHCKEEDFYGFSGLEESISKRLRSHFTSHWENSCDLYYLPRENFNPSLKKNNTKNIDIKDAGKIDQYYTFRNNHSIDRIKNDITNRPASAIYKNGEIVCWVLVHDDNSMGIMYTMEEHRGYGYAVDVTIDLCDKILQAGKLPFLQIDRNNNMSPGLAKKCGFVKCGSAIWFGGIKGIPSSLSEISKTINSKIKEEFNNDCLYENHINSNNPKDFFLSIFDMKAYDNKIYGFEIKRMTEDLDIKIWCDIVSKGYICSDEDSRNAFNSQLLSAMTANKDHYELYLGTINGRSVSTLGFYIIKDEAAGLCYVSTLPELKNERVDEITIYETFLMLKNTDWSIINIRSNENKYEFFKNIGAIEFPS